MSRAKLYVWSLCAHRIIVARCLLVTTPSPLAPPLLNLGGEPHTKLPYSNEEGGALATGGAIQQAGWQATGQSEMWR